MRTRRRGLGVLIGASAILAIAGATAPAAAARGDDDRGRSGYRDDGRRYDHGRGHDRGRSHGREHGRRDHHASHRSYRVEYRGGYCEPWPRFRPVRVSGAWCRPAYRPAPCRSGIFIRF